MGVGRLIGKLFGGDADESVTILRAYGKLPFYAEYRRLELAPGTPTAFSQWLDAGRLAWIRSQARPGPENTRASRLLIGLPDSAEAIVASIWPSRDNLGRHFPFAFFVVCSPDALGADAVERWASAASIHELFDKLHTQLHSLGSGGDFYRFFRKQAIPLRPDDLADRVRLLREEAARIDAADWFDSLSLEKETPAADWFGGLRRRSKRWTDRSQAAELALSCPLARGYAFDGQVALWLDWLGVLLQKTKRTPWIIIPADDGDAPQRFSLLRRGLLPDDYQLMTTDDRAYGFIEHLSQTPTGTEAEPSSDSDAPVGSLLTWLRQNAL